MDKHGNGDGWVVGKGSTNAKIGAPQNTRNCKAVNNVQGINTSGGSHKNRRQAGGKM